MAQFESTDDDDDLEDETTETDEDDFDREPTGWRFSDSPEY